jgi:hypothetical protein
MKHNITVMSLLYCAQGDDGPAIRNPISLESALATIRPKS